MKLNRIILLISFTVLILSLFSCGNSDEKIDKKNSGIFKVVDINVEDGNVCRYKLSCDDLVSQSTITIRCNCNKFQANQYLEFNEIDSYNEKLESPIYILDTNGLAINIRLAKDKDFIINYYKTQQILLDSIKIYSQLNIIKDKYIKSMEDKSLIEDSVLYSNGIKFDAKLDTSTYEYTYTIKDRE